MDSGSGRDRQEEVQLCKSDNVESENEPIEEKVPKILSPEVHEFVFHIFASMLDVKSFINLAMTSKDMYNRCTQNESIKINVDVDELNVEKRNGSLVFIWQYEEDEDAISLRNVPRKVVVNSIYFDCAFEVVDLPAFRDYMNGIGVSKISSIIFNKITESETVIAIIKDFNVDNLEILEPVDADILHSLLRLNLKLFNHSEPVPVDFILEIDSPIRIIYLGVCELTKNEFMQITKKIQTGSIIRLAVSWDAVDWTEFDMLPFDHQGPLPEHRPLLLTRTPECDEDKINEFWFLDSDGGVTKCTTNEDQDNFEFFKCEPYEYPWILRKEEDVLQALAEKRPRVSCTEDQFRTFFKSFAMVDPSRDGHLSKDRPLYFNDGEQSFWMLDENENLTNCKWVHGSAFWVNEPEDFPLIEHPAFVKHMSSLLIKRGKRPR